MMMNGSDAPFMFIYLFVYVLVVTSQSTAYSFFLSFSRNLNENQPILFLHMLSLSKNKETLAKFNNANIVPAHSGSETVLLIITIISEQQLHVELHLS